MTHYLGASRSLTVKGDARERARQQGLACAGEMMRAASSIGSLVIEDKFVGRVAHERLSSVGLACAGAYYLLRHGPALRRHSNAKYWRAQQGLADGAGLSLPLMFGLGAVPEIVGAQMGYTLGCSAIALGGAMTESGGAQIAYNHDFPPRFGRYNFVRHNHPSDGFASVCLSYPIMVGCLAGVNERGFAMTLNHAFSTDYVGKPGLLLTTLVQDCLDTCSSVAQAIRLITETAVTNGAILTLADAAGERAVVERSCGHTRVRRPNSAIDTGDLLVSFNKYKHPEMAAHEVPLGAVSKGLISGIPLHESNVERQARWSNLVKAAPRRFDDAAIKSLMSDHAGRAGDKNTICRHSDELSETLWGALLDTRRRSLKVVFGHTCSGPYVEYAIDPITGESRSAQELLRADGVLGGALARVSVPEGTEESC
mgnify:CR=1 FL=1